ncbi:unnamed protein product [Acidithrix sp. C25]|nr:unnamed protein product [Acidithrix sp. C25]
MQHLELHFFNVNLFTVKLALPPEPSSIEAISLYPSGFLLSIYLLSNDKRGLSATTP